MRISLHYNAVIPRLRYADFAPDHPYCAFLRQPDFAFPTHTHDFWEAFLCLGGSGIHECNNQNFLLSPGDLWMVRPDDAHSIRPQRDFKFINVAWPVEKWERWLALAGIEAIDGPWHAAAPGLESLFVRASRQFARQEPSSLELCRFWAEIAEALLQSKLSETRPEWMLRSLRVLESEDGLRGGWPLLLNVAHVSPGHFCREWKKAFNATPTEWINARRLEMGAHLLLQSNLPIKEISARCGFENTTYFYRLFSQKYGVAPKAYRLSNGVQNTVAVTLSTGQ
jgi:AraC family cel operon transcriptional repressor